MRTLTEARRGGEEERKGGELGKSNKIKSLPDWCEVNKLYSVLLPEQREVEVVLF